MARQYEVEGPRQFGYWALGLLALGLWCVKDGWFPSDTVLAKHALYTAAGKLDGFYVFNRFVAAIFLTASAVCAYVHRVVK